jgi:hypothetical protein
LGVCAATQARGRVGDTRYPPVSVNPEQRLSKAGAATRSTPSAYQPLAGFGGCHEHRRENREHLRRHERLEAAGTSRPDRASRT